MIYKILRKNKNSIISNITNDKALQIIYFSFSLVFYANFPRSENKLIRFNETKVKD